MRRVFAIILSCLVGMALIAPPVSSTPNVITVSGTVVGADGTGGWTVELRPMAGCVDDCSVKYSTADAEGRFSLVGPADVTMDLWIEDGHDGFWTTTLGVVSSDVMVEPITVPTTRLPTSVEVTNPTRGAALDVVAWSRPVALSGGQGFTFQRVMSLNADGSGPIEIPGGLPAEPSIVVSATGYFSNGTIVATGAPGEAILLDASAAPALPAVVEGTLRTESGAPGPWTVHVNGSGGQYQSVTDGTGAFRLEVQPGFYNMDIDSALYTPLAVGSAGFDIGEITLADPVETTVHVEDSDGAPKDGVQVVVSSQGRLTLTPTLGAFEFNPNAYFGTTGIDGDATVPGLYDSSAIQVRAQALFQGQWRQVIGGSGQILSIVVPAPAKFVTVSGVIHGNASSIQMYPVSGCQQVCSSDSTAPGVSGEFALRGEKSASFDLSIFDALGGTWQVHLGTVAADLVVDDISLPASRVLTRARVVDPEGRGVSGVRLGQLRAIGGSTPLSSSLTASFTWSASSGPGDQSLVTDADGYVDFPSDLPNNPTIQVTASGFIDGTFTEVTGAPGQTLTFTSTTSTGGGGGGTGGGGTGGPGWLTGSIRDASGARGPWVVRVSGSAGVSEVATDASGGFELPVTTSSDYELTIDGEWATGIHIGANGLSAGELVLPGRVDTTVIRVEDTNGVGVEGVDVDVTQQGSVTLSPTLGTFNRFTTPIHVVTGADGNVVVPGLYDTAEMSVWASTNYKFTQRNRFGTAGGTVLTVVPAEPPSVVVTGHVVGPVSYVALSPISGASTGAVVSSTPTAQGDFSLRVEKGATYEFQVYDGHGFWNANVGAISQDRDLGSIAIPVERAATGVRVFEATGTDPDPLVQVRIVSDPVTLSATMSAVYHRNDAGRPDATGVWTIPGGVPTDPSVSVHAEAFVAGTRYSADGLPGQTLVLGDPPPDGDGVSATVEAAAPNNGDGNGDGVQDAAQANVTSLPALGSAGGAGSQYVTVESPPDTTLSSVAVVDPADTAVVAVPPPAGVTLPTGLVSLVLSGAGVGVGSDQTVTIFTPDTSGVVGYAKYDPAAQSWTLLPADRVAIFADRVEIRLTDGGIGDDDGSANGTISDPGGIFTDTAAPVVAVTGVVEGRKYVIGSAPTPGCSASDAASGLASACTVSVTGGNANGVGVFTATATATDKAGNTATKAAHYKVVYGWRGFEQPIDDPAASPGATTSVFKSGSTVPAKFALVNATGAAVAPVTTPTWTTPTNEGATSLPVDEAVYALTADSGDVYKATGRSWQYNWKTSKAMGGSIWRIGVRLDDGEVHFVKIALR